ncbi:MAG: hypothetical protein QXO75_05480 [Nitrososphaerota archaeon]
MNAKKLIIFLILLLSPIDLLIFLSCEFLIYTLEREKGRLEQAIKQARGMEI